MAILKGNQSDDLTLKYLLQNNKTDTSRIESDIDALKETTQNLSEEINELDGEAVKDVKVDGTSVVTSNVAEIDLTGKSNVGHTHVKSDITDFPTNVSMKLLWTNDEPTSSFAAQTVSLDLSGYDAVVVLSVFSTSYQEINPLLLIPLDTVGRISCNSGSNNRVGTRTATVSSTGIEFTGASYNSASNNSYCVPYKIYGIKGIT